MGDNTEQTLLSFPPAPKETALRELPIGTDTGKETLGLFTRCFKTI